MNETNIDEIIEMCEQIHTKYNLKPNWIIVSPEVYKELYPQEGEWFYYELSTIQG